MIGWELVHFSCIIFWISFVQFYQCIFHVHVFLYFELIVFNLIIDMVFHHRHGICIEDFTLLPSVTGSVPWNCLSYQPHSTPKITHNLSFLPFYIMQHVFQIWKPKVFRCEGEMSYDNIKYYRIKLNCPEK